MVIMILVRNINYLLNVPFLKAKFEGFFSGERRLALLSCSTEIILSHLKSMYLFLISQKNEI